MRVIVYARVSLSALLRTAGGRGAIGFSVKPGTSDLGTNVIALNAVTAPVRRNQNGVSFVLNAGYGTIPPRQSFDRAIVDSSRTIAIMKFLQKSGICIF